MHIPSHLAQTIVDPHAYAAGDPVDDAFRTIRANHPLAIAEPEGMEPFWVVGRHADIMEVERQPDVFHNGDKSTFLTLKENDGMVRFSLVNAFALGKVTAKFNCRVFGRFMNSRHDRGCGFVACRQNPYVDKPRRRRFDERLFGNTCGDCFGIRE